MKGAKTNMTTRSKLLLFFVLALAIVIPLGIWYVRNSHAHSSSTRVAESSQPGPPLEAFLHLNVELPPGTEITDISAEPSITFTN
jgi:hypothetical protein